jgi:hypothetical protein
MSDLGNNPDTLLPGSSYYADVIAHDGLTQPLGPSLCVRIIPFIIFLPITLG